MKQIKQLKILYETKTNQNEKPEMEIVFQLAKQTNSKTYYWIVKQWKNIRLETINEAWFEETTNHLAEKITEKIIETKGQ